jgi:DNA ligase D-like protein (predicted 3'-phosphoesterase)
MAASEPLRFVVNRHHATTLHFDLRLEVAGVLVSWAVPKGPTLDAAARRLAVQVEDHELDEHLTLEDDRKVVWDTGPYQPASDPGPALDRGHLRFVLAGHKLRGAFALSQTRMGGDERNWILVKIDDEYAVPGHTWTPADMSSVISDRRLDVDR